MATIYTQQEAIEFLRSSGWQIFRSKSCSAVIARKDIGGRIHLKGFRGKSAKPAFYYAYGKPSWAERQAVEFIEKTTRGEERTASRKAESKAKRDALKASDHWSVGDVVYTSWGYDQTNVEFYQVTKVLPRSVVVRQVLANSSDCGGPSGGKIAPRRFEFKGPEIKCLLSPEGGFSAGPVYGDAKKPSWRHSCHKWEGRSVFTSSYA